MHFYYAMETAEMVFSLRCPLPPSDIISVKILSKRTTLSSNNKMQTNDISDLYMYTYIIYT